MSQPEGAPGRGSEAVFPADAVGASKAVRGADATRGDDTRGDAARGDAAPGDGADPAAAAASAPLPPATNSVGILALVGGGEWTPGCTFDAELLAASGTDVVTVLPTAAAYEHPERAVETARVHFAPLGAKVEGLMVLGRAEALDPAPARVLAASRFIYLAGGSPLHLRSVLKDSPLWSALVAAWRSGAVVAASSAGAMVLGDPMVDPRGGAFTLGLGLIEDLAVLPHRNTWSAEKMGRTVHLAPAPVTLLSIDEATAAIRDPLGRWRVAGEGSAAVHQAGQLSPLNDLIL
ncbi:MAG: Type 1 glutamine amidotransferase-like domain-containing protein [Acidimicrobiales bacterium]